VLCSMTSALSVVAMFLVMRADGSDNMAGSLRAA